jgi:hypothetical protein
MAPKVQTVAITITTTVQTHVDLFRLLCIIFFFGGGGEAIILCQYLTLLTFCNRYELTQYISSLGCVQLIRSQ